MKVAEIALFILLGASISLAWIFLLRKTSLGQKFLDAPNSRSSHTTPTVRGAGYAFAFSALIASFALRDASAIYACGIGFVLASVGLIDDALNISAKVRFILQALLCFAALKLFVQPLGSVFLFFSPLVMFCLFVYVQSTINFYNFADGINGHVALQFVVALSSWIVFSLNVDFIRTSASPILCCLVGSILIFLVANMRLRWVFMGDCGSTFLGFFVTVFPLYQMNLVGLNWQDWLLFFAALFIFNFIVWMDCFSILVTKVYCRVVFSKAHRNHFYQQLSRFPSMGHTRTSILLAFWQLAISMGFIASANGWYLIGSVSVVLSFLYLVFLAKASVQAAKYFDAVTH